MCGKKNSSRIARATVATTRCLNGHTSNISTTRRTDARGSRWGACPVLNEVAALRQMFVLVGKRAIRRMGMCIYRVSLS